jgi:aldehyde:ferredoxin oxidoreductase
MCTFAAFCFFEIWGPPQEVTCTFLRAAAGWEINFPQINDILQRIGYLSRCLSMREGFRSDKHSFIPERAFDEPVTNKYGKTSVWGREEWEAAKKKHYVQALKLTETGLPPRGELQRLGLNFVIPVLESAGVIG